jgi:site-specific DNA-methyltransferase (adenine-specific)
MILAGDCIEQMRTLEADSVDAIVTDPPYGLEFMGKEWDGFGTPLGFQTWSEQWAREALRVLKPGGHLLAFGGTRMYHRLAAGIEDAGFEIRDTLMWLYGSGFPKSLDVSKAIDKAAGVEGKVVAKGKSWNNPESKDGDTARMNASPGEYDIKELSESAKKWQGWGTALKPAVEPIVLARKPLIGTVAANVLTHGTGALNIDASRIVYAGLNDGGDWDRFAGHQSAKTIRKNLAGSDRKLLAGRVDNGKSLAGRWPANILLDEEAAALLDEQSGERQTGEIKPYTRDSDNRVYSGVWGNDVKFAREASTGGASRFFYVAKASRAERNAGTWQLKKGHTDFGGKGKPGSGFNEVTHGTVPKLAANIHPTVKPVDLMRYLIRLVTPKGGTVLDPFMGSGTTAVAAIGEGVNWIGCEREPEYVAIIEARIAAAQPGMGLNLKEDTQ